MRKFYFAFIKELLLLKRDLLGFIIIFLMPVILIITITYIQNGIENEAKNKKLPFVVVNLDEGVLSHTILKKLQEEGRFEIITHKNKKKIDLNLGKKLLKSGQEKVMILIPKNFSNKVQQSIDANIQNILSQVMPSDTGVINTPQMEAPETQSVLLYFDPTLNENSRNQIKNGINKMVSEIETNTIYSSFEKEFNANFQQLLKKNLIEFKEKNIVKSEQTLIPNAVQHNFPAWSLFAIFFIVLPLSINIVREKNQGTFIRLNTLPVSPFLLIISKVSVYLFVCLIQFYLMLFISVYLFPIIGLPALAVSGKLFGLSIVALFSGLSAVGFGVLIGTFAKTQEQAAPFGATAVVILAAIGGLWFPIYAMPQNLQVLARISPLNWGLESFYNVLLRNNSFSDILPYLALLFCSFIVNLFIVNQHQKKLKKY